MSHPITDNEVPTEGWLSYFKNYDSYSGNNAFVLFFGKNKNFLKVCLKVCKEQGFKAFVCCNQIAYFRKESARDCINNLSRRKNHIFYTLTDYKIDTNSIIRFRQWKPSPIPIYFDNHQNIVTAKVIPLYYINLEKSKQRRVQMVNTVQKTNLILEKHAVSIISQRINAINGNNLSSLRDLVYNFNKFSQTTSKYELACTCSHTSAHTRKQVRRRTEPGRGYTHSHITHTMTTKAASLTHLK